MTCARREAGAHRPAPSASTGSSRPDPRPGRRCARLFGFLPALALLLGALSPFAAAPAAADVLVSNIGQVWSGTVGLTNQALAQRFTAGDHAEGYDLTSIEIALSPGSTLTASDIATVRAELWSAGTAGSPDSRIVSLQVPSSLALGAATFAPMTSTRLSANTRYFVVIYSTGSLSFERFAVFYTISDNEDAGAASGWSVANGSYYKSANLPTTTTRTWISDVDSLNIRVNGVAVPAAPTNLSVTGADGGLDLTWTAPAGTVTGYDVHYTSAPSTGNGSIDDDAEASGSDPMAGWVDARHVGTAAWHRIAGLAKGFVYRVRVRGANAVGGGEWAFGLHTQVPTTPPGEVTGLEVRPGQRVLNVSWLAPSDTGGRTVSYRLHYTSSGTVDDHAPSGSNVATGWVAPTGSVTGTSHRLTDLSNGNFYRVRVQAYSDSGSGAWVHGRAAPKAAPPPGLTGLTLAAGSTGIDLVPAFSGTRTTYTAVVPPDATSVTVTPTWTGAARYVTAESATPQGSGLTNQTAISSSGGSASLDLASSGDTWVLVAVCWGTNCKTYTITVSKLVPPSVPQNVRVTPGDRKLTVSWEAPSDWGSWPGAVYDLQWAPDGGTTYKSVRTAGSPASIGAGETSFVFTGVQKDPQNFDHTVNNAPTFGSYDLRIRAVSQEPGVDGSNLRSDWVAVIVNTPTATMRPPTEPRNVRVTPGDGKLTLAWQAPSSSGDWPASGFEVHAKRSGAGDDAWGPVYETVAGTAQEADIGSDETSFVFTGGQRGYAVTNGVAYDLRIRAASQRPDNGSGSTQHRFGHWVTVENIAPAVPGPVTGLRVGAADGELELSWTAPTGPVTGYDVHYTSSASAGRDAAASATNLDPAAGWVDARHTGTAASHTIAGLSKGTRYRVRVRGVGAAGAGAWTHGARTVPVTPPGPPRGLGVVPGDHTLDVSWRAPLDTGARGVTVGYQLHYTSSTSVADDATAGSNVATGWVATTRAVQGTSHQIGALPNGTPYRVRVRTRTDAGTSDWTVGDGTPVEAAPPLLTGLTLAAGGTDIDLAPAFSGARTAYTATVPPGTTSVSVTPTWSATGATATVNVATQRNEFGEFTTYSTVGTTITSSGGSRTVNPGSHAEIAVRVNACAAGGVACTRYNIIVSKLAAPTAPRNVQVTPGDGKLTLTWAAPSDWGGWTAAGFRVQWKLSSADDSAWYHAIDSTFSDPGSTDTSFELTGPQVDAGNNPHTVTNGTAYDLRIRASSQQPGTDGTEVSHYLRSDWVTVEDSTPTADVAPAAPTGLTVTPGAGRLDLSWTAPSGTLTGYDVHYTSASADDVPATADASGSDASLAWVDAGHTGTAASQAIAGLTGGTAYRVRVRASNANGAGTWAFGDGTPTAFTWTVRPGAYWVQEGIPARIVVELNADAPADGLSFTATRLYGDDVPTVTRNGMSESLCGGTGPASEADLGANPPTMLTIAAGERRGQLLMPILLDTLADELDECFAVQLATTASGWSASGTGAANVTLFNIPVLSKPTGLSAAGDGQLNLNWTAPRLNTAQAPITGYEVGLKQTSAADQDATTAGDPSTGWVVHAPSGTGTTYALTGLTNGVSYDVRVRAINLVGNGAWSDAVTATPAAAVAPGAVTGLTVGTAFSSGFLTVRWLAPAGTVTDYDVHYTSAPATGDGSVTNDAAAGTDAASAWVESAAAWSAPDPGSASQQYTSLLSGLTDGTAYRVRVRASNAGGAGPWEFGSGTPEAAAVNPPSAPRNVAAAPGDGKLTLTWQAPGSPNVWGSWTPLRFEVEWKRSPEDAAAWWAVSRTVGTQVMTAEIGPTATSFEFTAGQFASDGTITVTNGTAYDLRIRAVTQKPGTDGTDPDNHFRRSAWVTVSDRVPMVQAPREPLVAPTTSQTLWSATLTVGVVATDTNDQPVVLGCTNGSNSACTTARLTDIDFAFDGTDHEVPRVMLSTEGDLDFQVNKSLSGKKPRLVLYVGDVAFWGRDAAFVAGESPSNSRLSWTGTGLSWSAGDRVSLRLVELPVVRLSVRPNPVAEGEGVSVEASLVRSTGADRPVAHIPSGTVRVPIVVRPGTADPYHDYGEGNPRLDGTRRIVININGTTHRRSFGVYNFPTHRDGDTDDETFTVSVDTASLTPSVVAGGASSVTVTIEDLDEPVDLRSKVRFSVGPEGPVAEGRNAAVSVILSSGPAADVTIPFLVTRGTSEEGDHGMLEGGITVPAGRCCITALLPTFVDGDIDDETFTVALDAENLPAGVRPDPDGSAPVEVTIADNGLPVILTDEEPLVAREGTDAAITFTVRLSVAAGETVSVDYATSEGDGRSVRHGGRHARRATSGADFTAASGTLTFAPGETEKTVSVPILDDAVNEGPEYFLHRLSNVRGAYLARERAAAVGLILNDDHLQKMWLARFGRTVGSQVTEAVSDRLGAGLAPGAHATLAGQPLDLSKADDAKALAEAMTGLAQRFGAPGAPPADDPGSMSGAGDPFARPGSSGMWNEPATTATARSMTSRELLLGSSFHVAPANEGSGPALAAWGRAAHGSFDGEHADDSGTTRVDGEVVTGVLGADADFGRVLAGVAVSLSEGEGKFDAPDADVGGSGKIESTMTLVSPYARLKVTERVSAWGLAGWGTGDMTIRFDDGSMAPVRTDLTMRLGAVGARGALLEQGEAGLMDLALKADAFFVRTESEKAANSAATTADASRVRLVLEGGRRFALSETAALRPSLELGVRHDGGDAETGAGVELGGGVSWADTATGFSVEAKARMLVAHADSDYEEWGASAVARLDHGERGRGLSVSLAPAIGAASSGTQSLWGAHDARGLAPGGPGSGPGQAGAGSGFEAARGLTAEAGYGMGLFGDRFTGTPNLGLGMSEGGARDYRIGWRLTSVMAGHPGFEVSLDATRREAANGNEPAEHGVMLRSLIRW